MNEPAVFTTVALAVMGVILAATLLGLHLTSYRDRPKTPAELEDERRRRDYDIDAHGADERGELA